MLYQRDFTKTNQKHPSKSHRDLNWYMKLRIGGDKPFIERSTKLTNEFDAYEFAKGELLRLQQAVRVGHSLKDFTFEQHWEEWFQRKILSGKWKPERQNWHKKYGDRYFKEYFRDQKSGKSMLLNEITAEFADDYWPWRITYWTTGPGSKLKKFNPKRRGAKTKSTNNSKSAPKAKTLQMEQSALNQIFFDAAQRARVQRVIKMESPTKGTKSDRRPHFEYAEFKSLVRHLENYRDGKGSIFKKGDGNSWHKSKRQQLYYFVVFMAGSGLRVGEARQLRWRDIKFKQKSALKEPIAEVTVGKKTKTGERLVQTQPSAHKALVDWRAITKFKNDDDLVWFGQKSLDAPQKPFGDVNKTFQTFLAQVSHGKIKQTLLFSRDGERRSLYSLRHYYATQRIIKGGVSVYDLSMNMGCKVAQIERHYSHTNSRQKRNSITGSLTAQQAQQEEKKTSVSSRDKMLIEAVDSFNDGDLSEEQLLQIVKMRLKPKIAESAGKSSAQEDLLNSASNGDDREQRRVAAK